MVYTWAFGLGAGFFLSILPLSLRLQAHFDYRRNRLFYSILLFNFIYLYSGYLSVLKGRLLQTSFLGKRSFIDLGEMKKGNIPKPSLFSHATFTKLNVFCEVGKRGDAFFPVMAAGFLRAAFGSVFSVIRARNKVISLNNYVVTKTDKNAFEVSLDSIFKVSLFGVIYSVIKDLVKMKLKSNAKKEKQND